MLFESGGNLLRRQRGGQKLLLEHLWPKLKMIVSCDYRMTTTGLYSDYILPAAQHYEKLGNSMPSVHHLNYVLCDHATPPLGESLPDHEIGVRLVEKIEERAAARGMKEFTDSKGNVHSLVGLVHAATLGGAVRDEEKHFEEADRRQRGLRRPAQGDHARDAAREGPGALHRLGNGGPRHLPGIDDPARRGAQPAALAHRGQGSLRHPGAARPVLHRPRVVPGGGRGAARPTRSRRLDTGDGTAASR